jgi:hypothetical protein
MMKKVESVETLNERLPVLPTVIKHLNCEEREKLLLKELFLTVYTAGFEDGQRASVRLSSVSSQK